jgi:hypothetical protein
MPLLVSYDCYYPISIPPIAVMTSTLHSGDSADPFIYLVFVALSGHDSDPNIIDSLSRSNVSRSVYTFRRVDYKVCHDTTLASVQLS